MKTIRLTMTSVGETVDEAINNLEFDLSELLRITGDGGEADLRNYIVEIR